MGAWFDWSPSPLRTYMANSTAPQSCTSWYGHKFEKFSDTAIFCPTCGTTKVVK